MPMNEPTLNVAHPIYSVFMKCWRCQTIPKLEYDGDGGLRCPHCGELLITLEDR
jgi:phage FluMu protein Com